MEVTRNIQMVDLKSQFKKIEDEVMKEIRNVIDTTSFINGPVVKEFEGALSEYLGGANVIGCGNGTDALQIALMALDLKPGDEVITTPFTFVATSEVIALLGLKPVFVDILPDTYLIDPSKIEAVITDRTKVIIPVHLYGQVCDMNAIMDVAEKHGVYVVEDNAQAIGSSYKFKGEWKKSGTIGHIGCTSFFPSKNLGCYGDGGAIMTMNDEIASKIRMIVNHGSKVKYYHEIIGVNSRLDSMQAAVLKVKLPHLDSYGKSRYEAAQYYNELLKDEQNIVTPFINEDSEHVFHQYTLRLKEGRRDNVVQGLRDLGIPCMIYYPVPLHKQDAYKQAGDLPISEELSEKVFSLPMHTELKKEDQEYIIENLKKFI